MSVDKNSEVNELSIPTSGDIIDSPIDPLQTREIENAIDSDNSSSSNEYFESDDSIEDENKIKNELYDELQEKTEGIDPLEISYESESEDDEPVPGTSGIHRKDKIDDNDFSAVEVDVKDQIDRNDDVSVSEGDVEEEETSDIYDEDKEVEIQEVESDNLEEESDGYTDEEEEEINKADDELAEDETEEEEYEDLDNDEDEEEFTYDKNYHPSKIPPIIENGTSESFISSLMELRSAIAEEENFPFVMLDEFQLELEEYMPANLFKQLSLIDEISKLITNTTAEFELEDLHPAAFVEPPTEDIPIDFKRTAERKAKCSQKSQKLSFLCELWWAWIESVVPRINDDFIKNFKQNMIDKMKPKNMLEYFTNEPKTGYKPHLPEKPIENNDHSTKLYNLQLIEDGELDSDYEPDVNAPIYYKMPRSIPDDGDNTPEYPDIIIREDNDDKESDIEENDKKRKRSLTDTSPLAKRRKLDTTPNNSDSFNQVFPPPPLILNRRRSSQSFRGSISPPLLTPQLTPRTPVKNEDSPLTPIELSNSNRSDNEISKTLEEEKSERAKARAERRKHKEKRRERRKNQKMQRDSIKDDSLQNRAEEFCDSESVLSISDVEVDLSLSDEDISSLDVDGSFYKLRKKLAELKETLLAEQSETLEEGYTLEQYNENISYNEVKSSRTANKKFTSGKKTREIVSDFIPAKKISEENRKEKIENNLMQGDSEPEMYNSDIDTLNQEKDNITDNESTLLRGLSLEFQGVNIENEELERLASAGVIDIRNDGEIVDITEGEQVLPGSFLGDLNNKFVQENLDDVSSELLKVQKDLVLSLFQLQKKSKMFFEFLTEQIERQSILEIIEDSEEKLFDNLEGPYEAANQKEMKEAYQVLSTYYKQQGVTQDEPEDTLDLMALKYLEISDRTF